ncbi:DUF3465 domain-containing protein [Methylococcaceae bacterium WWC4]|nr:DUF3465 domain-containing protein [Methylococcaceae bacterium WWC4]
MTRNALILGCALFLAVHPLAWADNAQIEQAYRQQRSDLQIEGEGTVIKLLADDNRGSRHQRFIIRLESGQTLLVAHNIDLAPKIEGLEVGDKVAFAGEYEWSDKGGTLHWTHRDPGGRHAAGWLKHCGRVYQ